MLYPCIGWAVVAGRGGVARWFDDGECLVHLTCLIGLIGLVCGALVVVEGGLLRSGTRRARLVITLWDGHL